MKPQLAAIILFAAAAANANTYSWSGGGASANWSDAGNWGFAGVPANGDTVVFPAGQPQLINTNNLSSLTLAQVRFAGAGGGYAIYGNAFALTGGVEATNTFGANTINNTITFSLNDVTVEVGDGVSLTLAGQLQGTVGLTKIGGGILTYAYSGSNPYNGTTRVNAGWLLLNVGGINAFSGRLVIGDGFGNGSPTVQLLQGVEMPDTQPVTVNLYGFLDLNNFSDTIGALTIQGGTVSTENGLLALNGDLTVLGSGVIPTITGNLRFNGGMHAVNIDHGPGAYDLYLMANVSDQGGGLLFTNSTPAGTFARIMGSNSFTGPVIIDNVTMTAETPTALGATNSGTTIGSHGTLFMYSTGITNETLTMAAGAALFAQANCVWTGPIVLNGNATIDCYLAGSTLTLSGAISGNGGFEKVDVGTLQLFGDTGNTYAGSTYIQSGTCLIDKGSGVAISGGTLTIGDHLGSSAVVRDINIGLNLVSTVAVAINEGGLLDLNGQVEVVGPITLSGGTISTGTGRLQIDGDVTTLSSSNNATLNGSVLFAGGLRTITVNHGPSPGGWDVMIPASIADAGSGLQFVNGNSNRSDVRLMGSNSFTGPLTVNGAMYLSGETPWALGATNSGILVTNGGTLFVFNAGITNKTVTLTTGTTLAGQSGGVSPTWSGPIVLAGDATIYGWNYIGTFDIPGAISGSGNLTVASDGEPIQFSGPLANTYNGTTTVAGSSWLLVGTTLLLAKPVGAGYAIPGALVISSNCVVRDLVDYQISSPAKPVTIQDTGILDLTNHSEWIGPLSLQGAQITTGTGILYLGGDITVNSSMVAMSMITGNASLWNGTKTITNAGHNFSPDFRMLANLGGNSSSGLIKSGVGEASLAGTNNTFPGPVTVNSGTLWLETTNALGNTNTSATVSNGASLFLLGNVAIGLKPLILNGSGGGSGALWAGGGIGSWAGNITLATNVVVVVATNSTLELSGVIGGPGNLAKNASGNLILDGSAPNNFTGTTLLQQGLLTLGKTNGPAIPGPLTIGLGMDGPNGDVVQALLNNQLSSNSVVNISSSGQLDLSAGSGFNTSVGSLIGTGTVQLGAHTLTAGLDNTTTNYNGIITGTASGALVKAGSGTWTLTGSSSFPGIMQVQGGKLFVNGSMPSATASFIGGAMLGGIGSVGPIGFNQGILAPGTNGPGILTISSTGLTLNTNDTLLVAINGATAGSGYSQLNVVGSVNLGNATLKLNPSVAGTTNSQLTIINNDGSDAVTGTFLGMPEGATNTAPNGAKFKISYHGGTGNDVVLTQISLPPPPSFTGIVRLSGGAIQLNGLGVSNLTYSVWANTNLATANWIDIGTATANALGVMQFTDLTSTNYSKRFYRFSWP